MGRALIACLVLLCLAPATADARRCDLRGTGLADRIDGGWPSETICGLGGNDLLSGRTGQARLFGGPGDDRLRGGSGDDRLDGGAGDDVLGIPGDFGADRGDDTMLGGPGNDRIVAGQGDDSADGGPGDDIVAMGYGDDRLALGGDGNDGSREVGGGLFGGAGSDLLSGGGGDDVLHGDGGTAAAAGDVIYGGGGNDEATGDGGDDLMVGGKGQDTLDGGAGNDVIAGSSGADSLSGGDGDDLLWALDFQDNSTTLIDPATFSAPGDNVIDCGAGNDVAVIDVDDDRTRPVDCEQVIVVRSARSSCAAVARWIAAGPNHVLDSASPLPEKPAWPVDESAMSSCAAFGARFLLDPTDDPRPNVRGSAEPDVLTAATSVIGDLTTSLAASEPASAVASVFNAGEGDDTIDGSEGDDTILAGPGDDTVYAGAGNDASVEGEDGDDALYGGPGDDVVFGRTGNDALFGEGGDDYLEGGQGDDALSGGAGHDELYGGFGVDRLHGGAGDDELYAYDGKADLVDCGPGVDFAEVDRYDVVRGCETLLAPRSRSAVRGRAR